MDFPRDRNMETREPRKEARHGPRKAVGLKYDSSLPAPFITSKAQDAALLRMLEIAQESGIPIYSNPPLCEALHQLPVNHYIPEDWYSLVANLLSLVYLGKIPDTDDKSEKDQ